MSTMPEGNLHTVVQSLTYSHVGQAIDSMRRSYDLAVSKNTGYEKMSAHQFAMSSIMHGFCFLESLVNDLGYKLLFNKDSDEYISEENRDFLLKKLASNWNMTRSVDKITFLLEKLDLDAMSEIQKQKIAEINNLRNILMHGSSYNTTMLLEPIGENSWEVHDQEDSVDWSKKFSANKFNSPVNLDYSDAKKCLETILNVCKQFYSKHSIGLSVSTSYPDGNYKAFYGEEINFDELLQLPAK
ncbi:hypothetical protein [Thiomicrorhabdus arctica]|uniref:hypothetical protein n=1 Tax=Thiomicrorhabdus arctica TaxID=131540 RepID=UPI00036BD80B|nr:hypothetical protein [Thiomicrorhabdus arctica]